MIYGNYAVIVVGGGHAGCEAALAAARTGASTLLITQNLDTIGQMSCNPAIGGIGKGHLVKEIDALGGAMALAIDQAGIQFRTLNSRKGPAVRATRAQADRARYKIAMRRLLESQPNLSFFQGSVGDLWLENDALHGIVLENGMRFAAANVVLTTGTFLDGLIHIGEEQRPAGRLGDAASIPLAQRLRAMAFPVNRLKTGTPPRLDGRTIDYAKLQEQPGDTPPPPFSFLNDQVALRQLSCHITYTNTNTHQIIGDNLHHSALYGGRIQGIGPRYCPSIEDKVVKFNLRDSHQIFLEPEGLDTFEVYPNGISTSLPFAVQVNMVRSMVGLERAHIIRPGYAIEYDFLDPRDLKLSLESQRLPGLFCAGQINGTTGYEEAAAQGLLAGLNAARQSRGQEPWIPSRDQSYLGVMIDDLVTKGVDEPYRMFTSRAEYRLQLREDNADLRLTPIGRELGLVDDVRYRAFENKRTAIEGEIARLKAQRVRPPDNPEKDPVSLYDLMKRPDLDYPTVLTLAGEDASTLSAKVREQVEIDAKYSGYINRQKEEIARQRKWESLKIPSDLDLSGLSGLSAEVAQKLIAARPETLGQASRISGVTPAAISVLMIHLKKRCA